MYHPLLLLASLTFALTLILFTNHAFTVDIKEGIIVDFFLCIPNLGFLYPFALFSPLLRQWMVQSSPSSVDGR